MRWPAPFWTYQDWLVSRGWHDWFAWHPVRVGLTWVWLETVRRRVEYAWGYRLNYYKWKGPS